MSAGVGLDHLVRSGAESFLQTVLVIDNELEMGTPPAETAPAPRISNPRPKGFGVRSPDAVEPIASDPARPAPGGATGAVEPGPRHPPGVDPSRLDVKTIMDAFLKRSLICGMHRPEGRDDLVGEAIKAARRSDAVIIDWLLAGSDPGPAKDIIAGILQGDTDDHGRLRLIVVYTSNPRIEDIAAEIMGRTTAASLKNLGGGVLKGSDTRIVVLNKSGTPLAAETVTVGDLPDRIITEFARLSEGLLSTFAVTAVAAVRRATHHVLAVFSSELDGAFLSHRCALKTPDDATDFALELLAGEFKGAIGRNGEATKVLGMAPLAEWVRRRARDGIFRSNEVQIAVAEVEAFVEKGEKAITDSVQDWVPGPDGRKPKGGLGPRRISPRTIGRLFNESEAGFRDAQHRFASLAQFKNEPYGRRAPRGTWKPMLTLGTLVVALDGAGVPVADGYLLCTQPRCDAVRIGERRRFPFQSGRAVVHDAFNVVATRPAVEGVEAVLIAMDMKPHDTTMIEFAATGDERVTAAQDGGSFTFTDIRGGKYLWLGDLRDLTAQRTAGKVAARLHDVGFDEFEWSRRHALEKPPAEPGKPKPEPQGSGASASDQALPAGKGPSTGA